MLYSSDSEGENVPVAVDDPLVFQTETSWSLQNILAMNKRGEKSKFPKANACSCQLLLPVVHDTYDDFEKDVTFAFKNTRGCAYA